MTMSTSTTKPRRQRITLASGATKLVSAAQARAHRARARANARRRAQALQRTWVVSSATPTVPPLSPREEAVWAVSHALRMADQVDLFGQARVQAAQERAAAAWAASL